MLLAVTSRAKCYKKYILTRNVFSSQKGVAIHLPRPTISLRTSWPFYIWLSQLLLTFILLVIELKQETWVNIRQDRQRKGWNWKREGVRGWEWEGETRERERKSERGIEDKVLGIKMSWWSIRMHSINQMKFPAVRETVFWGKKLSWCRLKSLTMFSIVTIIRTEITITTIFKAYRGGTGKCNNDILHGSVQNQLISNDFSPLARKSSAFHCDHEIQHWHFFLLPYLACTCTSPLLDSMARNYYYFLTT